MRFPSEFSSPPECTIPSRGQLNMRRLAGAAVGLAMWLAATLAGQQVKIEPRAKPAPKEESSRRTPNIRVDTTLILVPVSVNDPLNRPVSGLEKENFRLFEDKVPQPITQFAMDDEPVAVGLVFDTSGSMGEKLQRSRMAAAQFFRIANPEDEFFLVEFDDSPRLRVPLTSDTGTIENELIFSKSHGSTALLDAVYMALHEMKRSKRNKKALLIISDGGDNHSRYSQKEVTEVLRESDVLIYSIGVFGGASSGVVPACWARSPNRPAGASSKPTRWNCPTSPGRSGSSCAIATSWDIRRRIRRATESTTASVCRWCRRAGCRNCP